MSTTNRGAGYWTPPKASVRDRLLLIRLVGRPQVARSWRTRCTAAAKGTQPTEPEIRQLLVATMERWPTGEGTSR